MSSVRCPSLLLVAALLLCTPVAWGQPAELERLLEQLSSEDPSARARAAVALGEAGPRASDAAPALVRRLSDWDPQVRMAALDALGAIRVFDDPQEAREARELWHLIVCIHSRDARTSAEATRSLRKLGPKAAVAVPALTQALEHERLITRMGAAMALSAMGEEAAPAIPSLVRALSDRDHRVRASAAMALAMLGPRAASAAPALAHALGDQSEQVCDVATSALVAIGEPAVPVLTQTVSDPSAPVAGRCQAAFGLGRLGAHALSAVDALSAVLDAAEDTGLRVYAARALGEIGPEEVALVALVRALEDDSLAVRSAAEEALEAIGEPALVEALASSDEDQRRAALSALRRMGPKAKTAIPALVRLLERDPSTSARVIAVQALGGTDRDSPRVQAALFAALHDHPHVRGQACEELERCASLDLGSRWWVVPWVYWRTLVPFALATLGWFCIVWRRPRTQPRTRPKRVLHFAWVAGLPLLCTTPPTVVILTRSWAQPFIPELPILLPLPLVVGATVALCVLLVSA